ncbi:LysR substrate-binding domain-containing protein [Pendulispora albinea]|uniref:LysR family transcriptional regulator n=1 Tax=Pendulispora albinea TaxID=2741071 RepID=A0ABZ2M736_9BACT
MDHDLNDARFFAEVVGRGSFSAAARSAGLPVSTVSRRIARLEARLGVALLTRTTRQLALTEAGRVYHDHAVRAVAELDRGEKLVQDLGARPKGRIRLAATYSVAVLLWPTISEFLQRFGDVSITLDAHERRVNLVEERYDLAVRTGELDDSSMIARKVLEGVYGFFASPDYIARRGRPRTVRELGQHDCVLSGDRSKRDRWIVRQRRRTVRVAVRGRIHVNEIGLARQATLDGYGIGRLPLAMASGYVREGHLVRVLPNADSGPIPVWIVYPSRRALSAAMRAFVDYLVERLPRMYEQIKRGASSITA